MKSLSPQTRTAFWVPRGTASLKFYTNMIGSALMVAFFALLCVHAATQGGRIVAQNTQKSYRQYVAAETAGWSKTYHGTITAVGDPWPGGNYDYNNGSYAQVYDVTIAYNGTTVESAVPVDVSHELKPHQAVNFWLAKTPGTNDPVGYDMQIGRSPLSLILNFSTWSNQDNGEDPLFDGLGVFFTAARYWIAMAAVTLMWILATVLLNRRLRRQDAAALNAEAAKLAAERKQAQAGVETEPTGSD